MEALRPERGVGLVKILHHQDRPALELHLKVLVFASGCLRRHDSAGLLVHEVVDDPWLGLQENRSTLPGQIALAQHQWRSVWTPGRRCRLDEQLKGELWQIHGSK